MHRAKSGTGGGEFCCCGDSRPDAAGGIRLSRAELDNLRKEIERIDKKILELVSQRCQASAEIGLVKQRDGIPTRDRRRERTVKESYARLAGEYGIDRELAVKMAELLISDSVRIQKGKFKKDLAGKKALVVGGSGRMGAWFCRRLSNRGATVSVWDPRGQLDGYTNVQALELAVRCSDIIVISSPLGVAPAELKLVLKANPKGLVFDVCSVKSHLAKQLRAAARSGVKITSVHPMFGPSVATSKGRTIIVCDCGNAEATRLASRLFEGAGAIVVGSSLERHDELMAYVLGLPHITSMLFAMTLTSSARPLNELVEAQGPSFERMLAASRELSKESVRVYHDIQALNPNTRAMFTKFINSVKFLRDASIRKDSQTFRRLMESNRRYLEV